MGLRRIARECALQMLYEMDVGKHAPREILNTFWDMNQQPDKVRQFANELFQGSIAQLREIDHIIQQHTKNWRLSRMAAVDRNILRLAVYELLWTDDVPPKVAINEAIEIAKKFGTKESSRFINGVLDRIHKELRPTV